MRQTRAGKGLGVGELARRAGVSVRTLHYYEEVGLLVPRRTAAGHRRYDRQAIARLLRIRGLQQLGLSLEEIGGVLDGRSGAIRSVVTDQLARVRAKREVLARLEQKLERLLESLGRRRGGGGSAVDAELLLSTLEAMTMYDKHLSAEQLEQINAMHDQASGEAWQQALDGLRQEMVAGTDPGDPRVAELAGRWHEAARAFMPDDAETHAAALKVLHDEPQARRDHGIDDELFAYLGRALADADH